jgi:quercetin dioxygenase-like cupin family protein
MRVLDLEAIRTAPIDSYESLAAASAVIGEGEGTSQVHWLRFEAGGVIGSHRAGVAQLLVPVHGDGWVAGADGVRHPISPGRAAYIAKGEIHSRGSDSGMTALMVQLSGFELARR